MDQKRAGYLALTGAKAGARDWPPARKGWRGCVAGVACAGAKGVTRRHVSIRGRRACLLYAPDPCLPRGHCALLFAPHGPLRAPHGPLACPVNIACLCLHHAAPCLPCGHRAPLPAPRLLVILNAVKDPSLWLLYFGVCLSCLYPERSVSGVKESRAAHAL